MSMSVNETPIKIVTFNGKTVETWKHNGSEVFDNGCIITITGVSNQLENCYNSYVMINGVQYGKTSNIEDVNLSLPKGTVITCYIKKSNSSNHSANVKLNNEMVAWTNDTAWTTYDYIVKTDATIQLRSYTVQNYTGYIGTVVITES